MYSLSSKERHISLIINKRIVRIVMHWVQGAQGRATVGKILISWGKCLCSVSLPHLVGNKPPETQGRRRGNIPLLYDLIFFFPLFLSSSYFLQNIFGRGCFIRRWTGNVCKRITDFPCMLQYWESQSSTCIPAVLKEVPTAFFSPFM